MYITNHVSNYCFSSSLHYFIVSNSRGEKIFFRLSLFLDLCIEINNNGKSHNYCMNYFSVWCVHSTVIVRLSFDKLPRTVSEDSQRSSCALV